MSVGSLTNNCLDFGAEREEIAVLASANILHPSTVYASERLKQPFCRAGGDPGGRTAAWHNLQKLRNSLALILSATLQTEQPFPSFLCLVALCYHCSDSSQL